MVADNERTRRAVMPTAEPASLVPSDDTAGPTEGGNTENKDGKVDNDTSDFCRGATDRIFSTGDNDEATDRLIG